MYGNCISMFLSYTVIIKRICLSPKFTFSTHTMYKSNSFRRFSVWFLYSLVPICKEALHFILNFFTPNSDLLWLHPKKICIVLPPFSTTIPFLWLIFRISMEVRNKVYALGKTYAKLFDLVRRSFGNSVEICLTSPQHFGQFSNIFFKYLFFFQI